MANSNDTKKRIEIQQKILDAEAKNQLVSAGAGSGKTTVMIEKITNLILEDKIPISSLLVVTFTVLAAEEMKARLIANLNRRLADISTDEEAEFNRIIDLIEEVKTASIDTIDGFSSKTIKKYFYVLDISPNVEIISDATRDYYLTRAMKISMDTFSKEEDKINVLLDIFGGNRRSLKTLEEFVLNAYNEVINIENYEEFLANSLEEYSNSIKSERIVNEHIIKNVERLKCLIRDNYQSTTHEIKSLIDNNYDQLERLNKNLSLKSNLHNLRSVRLNTFDRKTLNQNPNLKDINKAFSDFNSWTSDLFDDGIDEDFELKNQKIYEIFGYFIEILTIFIKNYKKIKEKNNFLDFNDLNRLMLKLLEKENVKAELHSQYKYIFVDEYQDVNPLQDSLMKKIVSGDAKLFTVGDVKQSIYGFRGASPEWFLKKYETLKNNPGDGEVFDMNVNFRSNPLILNFINEIFSTLMVKEETDIDYESDCMIEPQRQDIVDDKVKILLLKDAEEDVYARGLYSVKEDLAKTDKINKQAYVVYDEIVRLLGSNFYDANIKENRALTYKDIAILVRSEKDKNTTELIDLLKRKNIPLNLNTKLDVEKSEGIKIILSILKCVVGLADDVDYLATFCSLANMSMDEIVEIRDKKFSFYENLKKNHENEKILSGFALLEQIKNESFASSNSELIRKILNKYKLKYFILRHENGQQELATVEEFLDKISPIEDGLNLAEFVGVIESNVGKGADYSTMDREDSVTIQTIHKSKGLEYPVVILFDASKQFPYLIDNEVINFNSDIGFGVDFYDTANRTKSYSVTKYAIKLKNKQKGYKEELRLLYVALTRAKNKLIIIGKVSEKSLEEKKIANNSYLGAILSCFLNKFDKKEFENCEINVIDEINVVENKDQEFAKRDVQVIGENFVYPNENKFKIPLKNSVTGLVTSQSEKSGFRTKDWLTAPIQYEASEDRALKGTHYHMALEALDLKAPYFKNTEFPDVDYKKIEKAYEVLSSLANCAIEIKKEAEFMMYIPYNRIVESEITDKVLVQGVVDLMIEKVDGITLVDYKFSRLKSAVLKEKYSEQLKLYKIAIETALKKPVNEIYIYSVETGELV